MATNFRIKYGEIGRLNFIRRLGVEYRNFDSKDSSAMIHLRWSGTSCKHLVNSGSVTPEFKKGNAVHLSSINSLPTQRLLDLAGISTEFPGAITTQFSFTNTLEDVTAIPRGLHAMICHEFLVFYSNTTYTFVMCQ